MRQPGHNRQEWSLHNRKMYYGGSLPSSDGFILRYIIGSPPYLYTPSQKTKARIKIGFASGTFLKINVSRIMGTPSIRSSTILYFRNVRQRVRLGDLGVFIPVYAAVVMIVHVPRGIALSPSLHLVRPSHAQAVCGRGCTQVYGRSRYSLYHREPQRHTFCMSARYVLFLSKSCRLRHR